MRLHDLLGTRVLVADGAMGTVLHAAGNPLERALPELNLSDPDLVRGVHASYLAAGVDLVQTNTFGAGRLRLEEHGLGERAAEINAAGVALAREAVAGRPALVVGSVSPAVSIRRRGRVGARERQAALREQVAALAGVDVLVCETFGHLDELVEAVGIAGAAGTLPVIAQATFAADGRTLSGHTPRDVCRALEGLPVAVVGTNCTLGPQGVLAVVEQLVAHTDLPVSALPNAGLARRRGPSYSYDVDPGYLAHYAERLVAAGAAVVGGCCGTTPAHLAAIASAVAPDADGVRAGRAGETAEGGVSAGAAGGVPGGGSGPGHGRGGPAEPTRAVRPAAAAADRAAPRPAREIGRRAPARTAPVPDGRDGPDQGRSPAPPRVLAEVEAPLAGGVADTVARVAQIRALGVGAVWVPPGDGPRARLSPVNLAVHLQNQLGVTAIACVTTWDRTIMALQADLLGAHALGVRRVVCETGSPPLLGDYPHADGVWDVDSLGLVELLAHLNDGRDRNGLPLAGRTAFEIGARVAPGGDVTLEAARALRKVAAGAEFLVTRPVYDAGSVLRLREALGAPVPLLAVVRPLASFAEAEFLAHEVPDVAVPPSALAALSAADGGSAQAVGQLLAAELVAELVTGPQPLVDGVVLALPGDRAAAGMLLAAARGAEVTR
ncbi:MAG: homocysteine S-methyltransferase family protein [Pseudonocardia sp.]